MTGNAETKRSRFEIAADILKLASEPAQVTQIVYGCNLNFTMVHKYIDRLVEAGLLRRVGEPPAYEATDKGRGYLEAFRRARRLLEGGETGS